MSQYEKDQNLDQEVINGFGHEWAEFDYLKSENDDALDRQFVAYCAPININQFNPTSAIAADFGAGSGRWTSRLLPFFSTVYSLEPSEGGSKVLKSKFINEPKVKLLQETVGLNSIPDQSLDLGMSLGVLHHIPDTELAIKSVASIVGTGFFKIFSARLMISFCSSNGTI
jgi:SAM-dependent methyltransferase